MTSHPPYEFGRYQYFVSDKMRKSPRVAKLINKLFGYTEMGAYARQLVFRRLLRYVPMDRIKTILDLGCGQGEFSLMLADAHKDKLIDAIDLDRPPILKIQQTIDHFQIPNLKTYNCKIEDLDRHDYYDLIFSVDVFEHIPEEQMPFKACYEKLKQGGHLIIKVPNTNHRRILPESWFEDMNKWLHDEHVGQIYDLPELVERFKKENFKVVAAFYSDGMIARAGWEFNYIMKKGGPVLQLISLPIAKLMMRIDGLFKNRKRGNYIQVVGQKVNSQ